MDETLWHKCHPPFRSIFVRLPGPDGSKLELRSNGAQLWRRKVHGKWEYRQDEPTFEEWEAQQF